MKKLICLLAAAACSLSAQVYNTNADIKLDGKLTEEAWQKAKTISDFRPFSNSGLKKLRAGTSFKVLAKGNCIYIGVRCDEPMMDKLKAPDGGAIWNMDGVEFFMAPTGQSDEFYQFLVTAGNIRWSQWYGEGGVIRPDPYAPLWESQVYRGKDFWSIEAKFPLSGFYMTRNQNWKKNWLFNITRTRYPQRESATWSPLRYRSQESSLFRTFNGFPIRKASDDIYVKNLVPASVTAMGNGYRASSVLEIQAADAAAGNYSIVISVPGAKPVRTSITLKSGLNKITVPNTYFPKQGKNMVRIDLENGLTDAGRYYPVNLTYNPIAIRMVKPNYSNVFYPDQDHSSVAGKLVVSLDQPAKVVVSIAGDGVPAAQKVFENVKGVVPFTFDTAQMKYGKTVVTAEVFANGKKIAETRSIIRRPVPPKGNYYRIENGSLLKNGKPCFPREVYARYYQGGEAFKKKFDSENLHRNPFNNCVLEPFRLMGRGIEPETTRDQRPNQKLFDAVKRKVEKYRNQDFTFYYLSDEPECRSVSPIYLKYLYDYVKELDPFHPVLIGSRASSSFVECSDAFSTHPYPGPFFDSDARVKRLMNVPICKTRDYITDITSLGRGDKLIGLTPQFFSYGNITNKLSDYLKFDELECTIWSSIINGGRLQWAYAYHDLNDRPTMLEGLRYIFESIEILEPVIIHGKVQKLASTDPMLEGVLLTYGKESLLLLCNVSDKALSGTLTSTAAFPVMHAFRAEGKLPAGKRISANFKPYEVKIFRSVPTRGIALKKDVAAMIDKLEKARSARNNFLHGKGNDVEIDSSNPSRRNNLCQQGKLFDGTIDNLAWEHIGRRGKDGWLELSFPKFVPTFKKIRLFGYNTDGVVVKYWKFGEWKTITEKPIKCGEYGLEWELVKAQRTVKIRFDFPGSVKKNKVEIYEVELVK